jgi:hypothetical protein
MIRVKARFPVFSRASNQPEFPRWRLARRPNMLSSNKKVTNHIHMLSVIQELSQSWKFNIWTTRKSLISNVLRITEGRIWNVLHVSQTYRSGSLTKLLSQAGLASATQLSIIHKQDSNPKPTAPRCGTCSTKTS